jgi:peptide-methionine (R)-S-oxide reductase
MNRRRMFQRAVAAAGGVLLARLSGFAQAGDSLQRIIKTDAEWRKLLSPEQYEILREEGTERPFTSPLNHETRSGLFVCIACDLPLFPSKYKFDSGTGWPSFFDVLPGHIEFKTDYKLVLPRTEYHCARCNGHHGHVFDDGPRPTGLRYCNNGAVLRFIPDKT